LCAASLEQLFWKNDDHSKYLESMPPAEDLFYQLAIGLDYIHKTGLIHRDIKPQNVLIWMNPTTNQVLMKWGGLRLSKGGNKTEKNDSTLDWLAPELLKLLDKGDFDVLPTVKSDVFAQGLVFGYYLLRGQHLFGSPVKAASNIMANEPVNLQSNSGFSTLIYHSLCHFNIN
jgi:serine/threonine protein kinase